MKILDKYEIEDIMDSDVSNTDLRYLVGSIDKHPITKELQNRRNVSELHSSTYYSAADKMKNRTTRNDLHLASRFDETGDHPTSLISGD